MMITMNALSRVGWMGRPVALCSLALGILLLSGALRAEELTAAPIKPRIDALRPGEILTYDVSWSDIVTAGIAVMEIKEGRCGWETGPQVHRDDALQGPGGQVLPGERQA